jgi:hypothetical protein
MYGMGRASTALGTARAAVDRAIRTMQFMFSLFCAPRISVYTHSLVVRVLVPFRV